MPIDDFSHSQMADLAPRAINHLMRKALTAYADGKLQEAADAFTCLIDDAPAEAALIDRSWRRHFIEAKHNILPEADIYPKVVKVSPDSNNDDALAPSETWRILFTDPDKKGPRTETIKTTSSTTQLLKSTYLTARGTIHWEMGLRADAYKDFRNAIDFAANHVALFRSGLTEVLFRNGLYRFKRLATEQILYGFSLMTKATDLCPKPYHPAGSLDLVSRNNLFEAGYATIFTHGTFADFFFRGTVNSEYMETLTGFCRTNYPYAKAVWCEINEPHIPLLQYLLNDKLAREAGYDINRYLKNDKLAQRREWVDDFLAEDTARQMLHKAKSRQDGFENPYCVSFESDTPKLPDYTEYLRQIIRDAFNFYASVKQFTDDRDIIGEVFLNTALHSIYLTWGRLPMKNLDELASQLYFVIGDTSHADLYASYDEFRLGMYTNLLKTKEL